MYLIKNTMLNGIILFCAGITLAVGIAIPVSTANTEPIYRITNGSSVAEEIELKNIPSNLSESGFRITCRVSHFSYDDSLVFPNQPGKAHLHMFMGNVQTDAFSTDASILDKSERATCSPGSVDKSAYWIPALLNDQDQVVMPEDIDVYYKELFNTKDVQRVPNNLQMIGSNSIMGCLEKPQAWFDCASFEEEDGNLKLKLRFANCLQIDSKGDPVLTSDDQSHGAVGLETCPDSHPYRIPMISIIPTFNINPKSDWKLSSDLMDSKNPKPKGSTLHGDIITSWSEERLEEMFQCNKEGRNCNHFNNDPEALTNSNGEIIYSGLNHIGDDTPLGKLPIMLENAMSKVSNHNMPSKMPMSATPDLGSADTEKQESVLQPSVPEDIEKGISDQALDEPVAKPVLEDKDMKYRKFELSKLREEQKIDRQERKEQKSDAKKVGKQLSRLEKQIAKLEKNLNRLADLFN